MKEVVNITVNQRPVNAYYCPFSIFFTAVSNTTVSLLIIFETFRFLQLSPFLQVLLHVYFYPYDFTYHDGFQ